MDLKKEIAELESVVDDRLIHPGTKYQHIVERCQRICATACQLWPVSGSYGRRGALSRKCGKDC